MKKLVITICFILCFTGLSNAQKTQFKTGKPSTRNYYTQVTYEDVRGKMIIPVSIDGENYRFLFDTGAPNILSKALWDKIGSKKVKNLSVSDANQKKQKMKLAVIPELKIGNVTFKNTSALIFEGKNNLVFECYKIDGFIGSNILKKSIVQIRSKEQLLILTNMQNRLNLGQNKPSELMLRGNQSSPYIKIKLKGEDIGTENLLFDTGASGFYDLSKQNYKILNTKKITTLLSKASGSSSIGMFGMAEKSEQYRLLIPEITVNNHVFKNVITVTGNDNSSRIGSDILDFGIPTLNFITKEFYFETYNSENDLNERLFGFDPTVENNKLVVGFVWDENLKKKISFGDEIIEINDTNLENTNVCDFITKTSVFRENDTINMTVRTKKGKKVPLILHRK